MNYITFRQKQKKFPPETISISDGNCTNFGGYDTIKHGRGEGTQ